MDGSSKHIRLQTRATDELPPNTHTHAYTHAHINTHSTLFTNATHSNLVRVVLVANMVVRARVAAAEHEVCLTLWEREKD